MKNNTLIWLLAIFAVLVVVSVIQYKAYHKEALAPTVTTVATTTPPVKVTTVTTTSTTTIFDSKTYTNTVAGFDFQYPAIATLSVDPNTGFDKISFPVDHASTTSTLGEKYISIVASSTESACDPVGDETIASSTVTLDETVFQRVQTSGVGAGNIYNNVNYIGNHNGLCINVNLLVHSSQGGNYYPVRPNYDPTADFAQFDSIMQTLQFIK